VVCTDELVHCEQSGVGRVGSRVREVEENANASVCGYPPEAAVARAAPRIVRVTQRARHQVHVEFLLAAGERWRIRRRVRMRIRKRLSLGPVLNALGRGTSPSRRGRRVAPQLPHHRHPACGVYPAPAPSAARALLGALFGVARAISTGGEETLLRSERESARLPSAPYPSADRHSPIK